MKTRFLIGSGKAALIRTLCLCFGLLLLNLLPAPAFATTPTTEPADIAALRASQARSAADLRLQAIKLRNTVKDPKHRAWAALALAEFENDLENADAALAMLTQAYNEAENLKLDDLKFLSLNARSTILVNRGRSDETDSVLKEMKAMVDASGGARPEWQAQWLDQRGVLERKLGHFDSSLDYFRQSLGIYRKLKDPANMARELNSIGVIHGRTGKFSDAVVAHTEALELSRKAGDRAETARGLRMLGVLYRNLDDEELGSQSLLEGLAYVEERNVREAITLHGELSKSLTLLDRMSEAEYHAQQAVKLSKLSGSPPNRVNSYARMAELKLAQGKIDDADYWTKLGFESFNDVAIRDQTLLLFTQAKVSAARGQSEKALKEAQNTLVNVRKIGDRILERAVLDLLAEQQLKVGDAASAYITRKEHQALDKALSIDMAARKISALEGKLERERSEAERAMLERDNAVQALTLSRQRLLGMALIAGLAVLLVIAGLLYWRYLSVKRSEAEISASRDKLAKMHTSLIDSSAALERVAHTDALTGLGNRHALTKKMEQCLAKGTEQRRGICIQLLDLDFFKQINDKHGHLAGDAVLREVAARLTATLPANTAIGRWGGEEFILLFEQIHHADAMAIAEKVRQVIAATPVIFENQSIHISTSIGIACNRDLNAHSTDPLLAAADAALYRAKNNGRNRVETSAG
ncbi:MAG TPA: diguanylate cyclase [Arenimonas sp.]|jgi:diguanylate cyclase (GGDEF)-like protein|nr:diguanylate cyclase [Arenimonas sp.]HPW31936.1 diguanylate cyclase [Arenimonas sp.]